MHFTTPNDRNQELRVARPRSPYLCSRKDLLAERSGGRGPIAPEPLSLNKKLISFRLWLSRLGGVDLLVDVERENVVWMEAFADGGTIWLQAREVM